MSPSPHHRKKKGRWAGEITTSLAIRQPLASYKQQPSLFAWHIPGMQLMCHHSDIFRASSRLRERYQQEYTVCTEPSSSIVSLHIVVALRHVSVLMYLRTLWHSPGSPSRMQLPPCGRQPKGIHAQDLSSVWLCDYSLSPTIDDPGAWGVTHSSCSILYS